MRPRRSDIICEFSVVPGCRVEERNTMGHSGSREDVRLSLPAC
jgi:hypothetical protein